MREIERKFLVKSDIWAGIKRSSILSPAFYIRQAYIINRDDVVIRIRIEFHQTTTRSVLCVKRPIDGSLLERSEDQYDMELEDAIEIMNARPHIVKIRYHHDGLDIDEFCEDLSGLVVAEREYSSVEEAQSDVNPCWFGYREVTQDPRYQNNNLIKLKFENGELHELDFS